MVGFGTAAYSSSPGTGGVQTANGEVKSEQNDYEVRSVRLSGQRIKSERHRATN
jgi:hypothetical protein